MKKAFFIAATGQNVGKTTTSLGLIAGLKKRNQKVGFLKPVGQEHVETENGKRVDKDVLLFKSHFQLEDNDEDMSPVLFPKGFTRDYLDGNVNHDDLVEKITHSFHKIATKSDITIVEGTGHTGVGSIVDLNNAQVAAALKCPIILVASGGLGSAFDELMLNYTQCEKYGVRVAGVILNRVLSEKREMVEDYMTKALKRWGLPLLGCIPYDELLSCPSMLDFELLFQTELLSGKKERFHHFPQISLVANSVEIYKNLLHSDQLIITPAAREDIILATLSRYWDIKITHPENTFRTGMILTGKIPPSPSLVEEVQKADIPILYAPVSSFVAMKMINSYTAKIRKEDTEKIKEAITVVERHIDFDRLMKL
jgi:phosphate acetyltransferase